MMRLAYSRGRIFLCDENDDGEMFSALDVTMDAVGAAAEFMVKGNATVKFKVDDQAYRLRVEKISEEELKTLD